VQRRGRGEEGLIGQRGANAQPGRRLARLLTHILARVVRGELFQGTQGARIFEPLHGIYGR